MIRRAKYELIESGFICEMVKGHRPNKASWYAITWQALDRLQGFDPGAAAAFERGAYRKTSPIKNAVLTPSHGVGAASIAPSHGVGRPPSTPSHGAIEAGFGIPSTPSYGDHLEKPSAVLNDAVTEQAAPAIAPAPAINKEPTEQIDGELDRVRDGKQDPALWDSDAGEFVDAPAKPARPARAGAERWVKAALSERDATAPGNKARAEHELGSDLAEKLQRCAGYSPAP